MDLSIGYIILDIPYLWIDKAPAAGGLVGWNQGRFSRIYLVSQNQPLFRGYLFPPEKCPELSCYFFGKITKIEPNQLTDIRLNGQRVNIRKILKYNFEHQTKGGLPISVLYQALRIPKEIIKIQRVLTTPSNWPTIIQNPHLNKIKSIFPQTNDYSKLKITDVGLYSVTRWVDAQIIVGLMKNFMNQFWTTKDYLRRLTITDASAGVGGDVLQFAKIFKHVNAVELVPIHCAVIDHNLNVYNKRDNVSLVCANYLDVIGFFKPWSGTPIFQDAVYLDPPWGGPEYSSQANILLELDGVAISDIIWFLLRRNKARYVFVKVPRNVDLRGFPPHFWYWVNKFKLICMTCSPPVCCNGCVKP